MDLTARLEQTLKSREEHGPRELATRSGTMIDADTKLRIEWGCQVITPSARVGERAPKVSYQCQVKDYDRIRGDSPDMDEFEVALRHALSDYFQRLDWATQA